MTETLRRHFLREKEAKQLLTRVQQRMKSEVEKLVGTHVEYAESEIATIYLVNNRSLFAKKDDLTFPTIGFDDIVSILPQVTVNMGAVPHICNGADVMAPGVVKISGVFEKDYFVVVVDEQHRKPLAIGTALYDSETMKNQKHGRIVQNVHYVGDKLWRLLRKS